MFSRGFPKKTTSMGATRRAGMSAEAWIGLLALTAAVSAVPATRAADESKPTASAKDWAVELVPASLNPGRTVQLVAGHTQLVLMAIQASQRIRAAGAEHNLTVQVDMPKGMTCLASPGMYKVVESTSSEKDGRSVLELSLQVANERFTGTPGAQLRPESPGQKLFLSAPQTCDPQQAYIEIRLNDGHENPSWRWPVKLSELTPPAERPKRMVLGLWSTGMGAAGKASDGIGQLLSDSGIRYISQDEVAEFREAMKSHGILVGGHMYYGLFYDGRAEDQNIAGKKLPGNFPNPQAVAELPPGSTLAGVTQMVQCATRGDGMVTMDYEPGGTKGWAPAAVAQFKKQYSVSDAAFDRFHTYAAKNTQRTYESTDPEIAKLWGQWTAFGTAQAADYIRRLAAALHAQVPTAKLLVTCGPTYESDSKETLARGNDDAAMAAYADIIMPQMYLGYDGAAAKLVMQETAGWRHVMDQRGDKSQLWPLLLIRYAGAGLHNTPERLRQQILGTLASGSQGLLIYYPENMDATYWTMVARTTEDVANYEDYNLDGKLVEKQFPVSDMPPAEPKAVNVGAGVKTTVTDPNYALTAHELKGQVLLTLFNLEDGKDMVFHFKQPEMRVVKTDGVEAAGEGSWRVKADGVGFVVVATEEHP
jgi:hypothetical protein